MIPAYSFARLVFGKEVYRAFRKQLFQISHSFEEVDVGEFLHLVHIALGFDYFLVVEEDPGLTSAFFGGDGFAYECHVVPVSR